MSNCLESLSREDREIIAKRLTEFSYTIKTADSIEPWLKHWADAKNDFLFKAFGEKLIISKKVSLQANEEDKKEQASNIWGSYSYDVKSVYAKFLNKYNIYNAETRDSLNQRSDCSKFITPQTLVNNSLPYALELIEISTQKVIKIPKGTKITRFISKHLIAYMQEIENAYYKETLEKFISDLSLINNDRYFEGELFLSIHPMDYITMSDNDCGWESCMSWEYEGEYRTGTLEMLNSSNVIVAYMVSKEAPIYGNWNNKRWRELFIVDPQLIMNIKGYPYKSCCLEDYICTWLKELVETNVPNTIYKNTINHFEHPNRGTNGKCENVSYHLYVESDRMYNDCYDTHIGYITHNCKNDEYIDINYSGPAYCIETFQEMTDESTDRLIHISFDDDMGKCKHCGEYYNEEYLHSVGDDGGYVCDDCFERFYVQCSNCYCTYDKNEDTIKENLITVVDKTNEVQYFCKSCFEKLKAEVTEEAFEEMFTTDKEFACNQNPEIIGDYYAKHPYYSWEISCDWQYLYTITLKRYKNNKENEGE